MNSGVKLDPSKSKFKPKENKKTQQDFEKEISELQKNDEAVKLKAMQLSRRFMDAVNDKTLPENRGIVGKDVEKELINNLGSLALHINNDENQPEGIGSIGLITVLMNSLFNMRDRINEQSHKIYLLEQQAKKKSSGE